MPTFQLKKVSVPLFGWVEKKDEAWLDQFSRAPAATPITLDDAALDIIADELGLDADGLARDAERYAFGKYRDKARGMSGGRLGELGEVLVYLANRAIPDRKIVRVVSWRAGDDQQVKGTRFPQPDFIYKDPGHTHVALEVKSTEAFDYFDLRYKTKRWRYLQPCSGVQRCRDDALPQLGYVKGNLTPQRHSLIARDEQPVPFPVGKGVAAAVLAVDGRVNQLRKEKKKYKTPPLCDRSERNCWECVPEWCHFVLITMENPPGWLFLGGGRPEKFPNWIGAYRRWSQAVGARDVVAVKSTLEDLAGVTAEWINSTEGEARDTLRGFWGAYLEDVMRGRGLEIEVPQSFAGFKEIVTELEWNPAHRPEVVARESNVDEVRKYFKSYDAGGLKDAMFTVSVDRRNDEAAMESMAINVGGEVVEFRLMSKRWWEGETVDLSEARRIAGRLFEAVSSILPGGKPRLAVPRRLEAIRADVGGTHIHLAWESKPASTDRESPYWKEFVRSISGWTWSRVLGDPRTRLRVFEDGRGELCVPRSAFWR